MRRWLALALACTASCPGPAPQHLADSCGDGEKLPAEECDDGNRVPGDGCRANCTVERCGDGIVDVGEPCLSETGAILALPDGIDQLPLVADLDADGKLDIVGITVAKPMQWYRGNGLGGFTGATLAVKTACSSAAVGLVDGDATRDFVTCLDGDSAAFYRGTGMGAFAAAVGVAMGNEAAMAIAVADLDHDQHDDLVFVGCDSGTGAGCGAGTSHVNVRLSNGDGTFAATRSFDSQKSVFVAIADVDGDGAPDVITGDQDPHVSVLRGDGKGGLGPAIVTPVPFGYTRFAAADFDGDGRIDLAAVSAAGMQLLHGDGKGKFAATATFPIPGATGYSASAGDFDNDGRPDVTVGFRGNGGGCGKQCGGGVRLYASHGQTRLGDGVDLVTLPDGVLWHAAGDVNGDGTPDVVLGDPVGDTGHPDFHGVMRLVLSNP